MKLKALKISNEICKISPGYAQSSTSNTFSIQKSSKE